MDIVLVYSCPSHTVNIVPPLTLAYYSQNSASLTTALAVNQGQLHITELEPAQRDDEFYNILAQLSKVNFLTDDQAKYFSPYYGRSYLMY